MTAILSGTSSAAPPSEDYPPVVPGYDMSFPADHGAHPAFRVEWWYLTGFLDLPDNTQRSFQITFFRYRPPPGAWQDNPSAFTPHQIYMAHFALGDARRALFRHREKLGRGGLGLAGAASDGLDVWLEEWSLRRDGDHWRAQGWADGLRWDLRLAPQSSPVRHGLDGYSPKGTRPGQASYYYSIPRLAVSGTLVEDGRQNPVHGRAWMDHEWSSARMAAEAAGWDWVGLRFTDGSALMAYRFRDAQGGQTYLAGTWIDAPGHPRQLDAGQLAMSPLAGLWTSPATGTSYPLRWQLKFAGRTILVEPTFEAQEMATRIGPRYWEGAVRVTGDLEGEGFLELTGYAPP